MIQKLWTGIKWLSGVVVTIVAGYMAVEAWVIKKVDTAVEPVVAKVSAIDERHRLEMDYLKDKLEGNMQLTKMIYEQTLRNQK